MTPILLIELSRVQLLPQTPPGLVEGDGRSQVDREGTRTHPLVPGAVLPVRLALKEPRLDDELAGVEAVLLVEELPRQRPPVGAGADVRVDLLQVLEILRVPRVEQDGVV